MDSENKERKNEKGAAMVMVLLVSLLLLTASAGLLMESSMNTQNVSDATAEQQAYNAAESGLQATINVLRGNVLPSPLLNPSKSPTDTSNLISFRRAVDVGTSNNDSGTAPRLSRWLNYNYKSSGSTVNDRIVLGGNPASYTEHNGYAYDITIKDPDRTGEIVKFNTTGRFYEGNYVWTTGTIIKTVGTRVLTITYQPPSPNPATLDVSSGVKNANFGSFKVSVTGTGAAMLNEDLRFQIVTRMSAPYTDTGIMRGWIRTGKVELSTATSINFDFDSPSYDLHGSIFSLDQDPLPVPISTLGTGKDVTGNVTAPEPFRLVITSVGYGPRGAKKVLEATIQKNFFNGLSAPATLTLVGRKERFIFEPGTSANLVYSGDDISSTLNIPSIGATNNDNLGSIIDGLNRNNVKAEADPPAENVGEEVPFWLESPKNLHETLTSLRLVADSSGRLFTNGRVPADGDFGNVATGTGITYIEGDADLQGDGGGILVCTGKLTLKGNFKFRGLIIVTGEEGIRRNGAGDGFLYGNTVVAPYDPANLNAGFGSPQYDLRGGGDSKIQYDSSSVNNGMTAVSNFVLGVAEK